MGCLIVAGGQEAKESVTSFSGREEESTEYGMAPLGHPVISF